MNVMEFPRTEIATDTSFSKPLSVFVYIFFIAEKLMPAGNAGIPAS